MINHLTMNSQQEPRPWKLEWGRRKKTIAVRFFRLKKKTKQNKQTVETPSEGVDGLEKKPNVELIFGVRFIIPIGFAKFSV